MALAFPEGREAHGFDTRYLFSPDLLVAPVVQPGGRVSVWLPAGVWHDWYSGERLAGARRLDLELPMERFPVFAREGAEIPLAVAVDRTDAWGSETIPIAQLRRFG